MSTESLNRVRLVTSRADYRIACSGMKQLKCLLLEHTLCVPSSARLNMAYPREWAIVIRFGHARLDTLSLTEVHSEDNKNGERYIYPALEAAAEVYMVSSSSAVAKIGVTVVEWTESGLVHLR